MEELSSPVKRFDLVREVVVSPQQQARHEETERRGDQRFSDTAGDRGETRCLLLSMPLNAFRADDRAEQPDERRRRTIGQGRKPRFIPRARWQRTFRPRRRLQSLPRRKPAAKPTGIPKAPWRNLGDVVFMLRSAMAIASSSFSVLECAATAARTARLLARVVVIRSGQS